MTKKNGFIKTNSNGQLIVSLRMQAKAHMEAAKRTELLLLEAANRLEALPVEYLSDLSHIANTRSET